MVAGVGVAQATRVVRRMPVIRRVRAVGIWFLRWCLSWGSLLMKLRVEVGGSIEGVGGVRFRDVAGAAWMLASGGAGAPVGG
jgi:hypothetical protein